ncbi:unnamed protein product [Ranitomeya imitator]|uniref:Uncharacterized protein n=1 Tax=Ranitomeya imitator TaxID=111125 RepID=A0ABN9MNC1_9NEOB|nr:unnamed protein product [Ranitomeya imitator]
MGLFGFNESVHHLADALMETKQLKGYGYDIVPVYQIKGISKLFKLCLPKVQCFCDSLTSPPSERQFNALLMSVASLLANVCFPDPAPFLLKGPLVYTSDSSQKVVLSTRPGIGVQEVALSTSPSIGVQEVALSTSPSIGGQEVVLSTRPGIGGQEVALATRPSIGGQKVALSTSPSISGQEVALSTSPSISSQEVALSTSPSIGGQEEVALSTSPIIGGQEVALSTSPSIGGQEVALSTSPSISGHWPGGGALCKSYYQWPLARRWCSLHEL